MHSIKWWCFQWPWVTHYPPQTTPIFALFVALHNFVVSKHRDFVFGVQLTVASPSLWTTKLPWKGRGYITWPILNCWGPIHIVKFCTKGDCIKSCQITLKGRGFAHVTHACMRNCRLRKNSAQHSVRPNCDQQCRQLRTTAYRTCGARGHA